MDADERMALLEALIEGGVPAEKLMPGTGACALTESVRLSAHAARLGCGGVLMLPPFYYKGVDDDGLFASFSEVIERVGDARLRVYLYHIPPVTQVPISLAARFYDLPTFRSVRPPLVTMSDARVQDLMKDLDAIAFNMAEDKACHSVGVFNS